MIQPRQVIKNLKEPTVLYLMWQDAHVGNLYKDKFEYLDKLPEGFSGYPAFSIQKKIHEGNVLSVFLSRCPPRKRASYEKFLSSFALNPQQVTDFMLLGYTGAYLPSDSFHLLNPFLDIEPPFEFVMKIDRGDFLQKGLVESFHNWLEHNFNINLSIYAVNHCFVEVSK